MIWALAVVRRTERLVSEYGLQTLIKYIYAPITNAQRICIINLNLLNLQARSQIKDHK